jgi:hypothetical protein
VKIFLLVYSKIERLKVDSIDTVIGEHELDSVFMCNGPHDDVARLFLDYLGTVVVWSVSSHSLSSKTAEPT